MPPQDRHGTFYNFPSVSILEFPTSIIPPRKDVLDAAEACPARPTPAVSPLSSEFGAHKTAKARRWPWLEPFSVRTSSHPLRLSLGLKALLSISSSWHRKVDTRLHGKGNSKLPWRKAGQPSHLVDVVDSDQ